MVSKEIVTFGSHLLSASHKTIFRCWGWSRPAFAVVVVSKQDAREMKTGIDSYNFHMSLNSMWHLQNQHWNVLNPKLLSITSTSFHIDGCNYKRIHTFVGMISDEKEAPYRRNRDWFRFWVKKLKTLRSDISKLGCSSEISQMAAELWWKMMTTFSKAKKTVHFQIGNIWKNNISITHLWSI